MINTSHEKVIARSPRIRYRKSMISYSAQLEMAIQSAIRYFKLFLHDTMALKRFCFTGPGGHFTNVYEVINLRAPTFSMLNENCLFQCMVKIFCVEFQRFPLKFHSNYLTHTLKDVSFIDKWIFTSFNFYELVSVFVCDKIHQWTVDFPSKAVWCLVC